ncbi:MAG: hypothetical protein GDA48_27905 [Hormoscilla sp. GM102CHS1]|nr:hypothetical protein [Hormoscilla sp. GM102CHS1]
MQLLSNFANSRADLAGAIAAVGVTPDMCYRLKIVPMGIATSCRVRVQEIM